jgi:hypothetical protein
LGVGGLGLGGGGVGVRGSGFGVRGSGCGGLRVGEQANTWGLFP